MATEIEMNPNLNLPLKQKAPKIVTWFRILDYEVDLKRHVTDIITISENDQISNYSWVKSHSGVGISEFLVFD